MTSRGSGHALQRWQHSQGYMTPPVCLLTIFWNPCSHIVIYAQFQNVHIFFNCLSRFALLCLPRVLLLSLQLQRIGDGRVWEGVRGVFYHVLKFVEDRAQVIFSFSDLAPCVCLSTKVNKQKQKKKPQKTEDVWNKHSEDESFEFQRGLYNNF